MVKIKESVDVSVRTLLSVQLIQSAALFCRHAHVCEKDWKPDTLEPTAKDRARSEHTSYVLGTIFSATTFLEALINELFSEAEDEFKEHLDSLDDEQLSLLARMWRRGIPRTARFPILDKYDIFLDLLNRPQFDRGKQVYQDASNLVLLRNDLTHYEPEWRTLTHTPSQVQQHRIQKGLRGRFKPNPLAGKGDPFYPQKCLGQRLC